MQNNGIIVDRRGKRLKFWPVVGMAVILLPIGIASFARRATAEQPEVGLEWVQSASGPLAIAVEDGSPAFRAGLRAGDLLVSVDGRSMPSALDAAQIGWTGGRGEGLALVVERGQGLLHVSLTPDLEPQAEIYVSRSSVWPFSFRACSSPYAGRTSAVGFCTPPSPCAFSFSLFSVIRASAIPSIGPCTGSILSPGRWRRRCCCIWRWSCRGPLFAEASC